MGLKMWAFSEEIAREKDQNLTVTTQSNLLLYLKKKPTKENLSPSKIEEKRQLFE